jgi:hypothetical protein
MLRLSTRVAERERKSLLLVWAYKKTDVLLGPCSDYMLGLNNL